MGSCCSSESDASSPSNNRRDGNYKDNNNNNNNKSLNSTQSPGSALTPLLPSNFEPERELVFTAEAQNIFDRISDNRKKLRDRKITKEQIQSILDGIHGDLKQLRQLSAPPGDNQVLLARSITALGSTMITNLTRYDEGLDLQKEALRIYRRFFGDRDNEQIATSLNRLGVTILNKGENHDEAISYLQQSLEMRRRLQQVHLLGNNNSAGKGGGGGGSDDDPELAASLNSLGIAYEWVGRHTEAAKLQEEALQMYMRLHPDKREREDVHDFLDALNGVVSPRKAGSFKGNEVLQKYRQEHPVQPNRHAHRDSVVVNNQTGERELPQQQQQQQQQGQSRTISNNSMSFL